MSDESAEPTHERPAAGSSQALNSSLIAHRLSPLVLVAGVTLVRVVYLAFFCPYTLLEDEAHYWEWSRRPDWSYYSKGPGIAWSIAASTRLLGDTEFAVRLPGILFAAAAALAIAHLARVITGDRRAALYAAACFLLTPAGQIGGTILTIDTPYVACWALASAAAWRALSTRSPRAWAALGLALGIGVLFKYTILFLLPGLFLYALARTRTRRPVAHHSSLITSSPPCPLGCRSRRGDPSSFRGPAIGLALFAACALPILLWNVRHGWPTVHHLLGHAALPGGDMPAAPARQLHSLRWFLEFLGAQGALIGPVLVLVALAIARAWRLRADPAAPARFFLLCTAAPILLSYTALSLWIRVEGNWPVAGYVPLFALAGWAVADVFGPSRAPGLPGSQARASALRAAWHTSLIFGLVIAIPILRLDWVHDFRGTQLLERALRSAGLLAPDRRLVPVERLTGARAMAADAASLGDRLRRDTGLEPFYVAEHYGRAGLLAFYLPGRPVVYCSSSQRDEGRRTQYDYWPDTDLADAKLRGRPAVLIGSKQTRWRVAFERVEPVGRLPNETKKERWTFLGIGYRGFGE